MTTEMTLIFDWPLELDTFERDYPKKVAAGLTTAWTAVPEAPKAGGTPTPEYRVLDLDAIGGRLQWGRDELRACRPSRLLQATTVSISSAAGEERAQ